MRLILLNILAIGLLGACSSNNSSKTEAYSYELTENGCATGRHEFSNMTDYCNGLANNDLNKNCAAGLRNQTFNDHKCGSLTGKSFDGTSTAAKPSADAPSAPSSIVPSMPTSTSSTTSPTTDVPTLSGSIENSPKLAYDMSENGCATGRHEFEDRASFCQALSDDALNNGCAGDMRMDAYKIYCR